MISDSTVVVMLLVLAAYAIAVLALGLGGLIALFNRRPGVRIMGGVMLTLVIGFFTIPWGLGALSAWRMDRWIADTVILPETIPLAGQDVLVVAVGSAIDRGDAFVQAASTYADAASVHLLMIEPDTIAGAPDPSIGDIIAQPGTVFRPQIGPPEHYWSHMLHEIDAVPAGIDLVLVLDRSESLAGHFPQLLGPLLPERATDARTLHVFEGPGMASARKRAVARLVHAAVRRPAFVFPFSSNFDDLPRGNGYRDTLTDWICGDAQPDWSDFSGPPPVFCNLWF